MDLSNIQPVERKIEILHPGTKQPIGLRCGIVAIDDDRLAKLKRDINDEQLRLNQRGKFLKTEEIEDNTQKLLFAAMTGWEWYNPTGKVGDKDYDADATPNFHGEVPEFNRKNVKAVTTELKWIAEQLKDGIGDTDAFFTTSNPT